MKPILFLDVDGVLNAVVGHKDQVNSTENCFDDFRPEHIGGFVLHLSNQMAERLQKLDVEIIWSTTWGHMANQLISPVMGLPTNLRVTGEPPLDQGFHDESWWKFPLVQKIVEQEQRPFIWIDDDIPWCPEATEWAKEMNDGGIPNLMIPPVMQYGLQKNLLDLIEQWLDIQNQWEQLAIQRRDSYGRRINTD